MKTQPNPSDREVLAGLVERVTYQNAENGFCVIRVKARSHRDLVTVVGHAAVISAGEWITASGDWMNDRTHGQQFKARFLKTSAPTSVEGIEKYLASGMIRGIGPAYAKKLLRAFGEKVFDVIEAEPDRLREVDGIGPVRAGRHRRGLGRAEGRPRDHGLPAQPRRRHGAGGAHLQDLRRRRRPGHVGEPVPPGTRHPRHRLQDRRRHRHEARRRKTAMIRVRAGISYALTEAMDEGHCGLPVAELVPLAEKLLEVPQDLIRTALDLELVDGTVVADRLGETDGVFLANLHHAERAIADRLLMCCLRTHHGQTGFD